MHSEISGMHSLYFILLKPASLKTLDALPELNANLAQAYDAVQQLVTERQTSKYEADEALAILRQSHPTLEVEAYQHGEEVQPTE